MTHIEDIVALAKRRGFVYPTGELYGGIGGFYDFGPLGTELSRNLKDSWWRAMVGNRDDVVGLDSSIITHPNVWEASGHVSSFTDPLVECKVCHERMRADQPDEIAAHEKKHDKPSWTDARQFNLLFTTFVGPVEDSKNQTYLRGETCQGIFVNFNNVISSTRVKIPFGIAQIGKAFRNEVTPGKFLFRMREFEQMELEYFVSPDHAPAMLEYWKSQRLNWVMSLGIKKENLRLRRHGEDERAHYAADSWDIEYNFPDWGFKELEGIANRTDYDLTTHAKHSGKKLDYDGVVPYVIEPSIGVSRLMLAILFDAYSVEDKRTVLKLKPSLAPYKAAVFPLLANKPDIIQKAKSIYQMLKKDFMVSWDDRGNIGKRYLSQDEAGTPFCITVDFTSLEDGTVTIRDRDTTGQIRIASDKITAYIQNSLKSI